MRQRHLLAAVDAIGTVLWYDGRKTDIRVHKAINHLNAILRRSYDVRVKSSLS